MIPEHYLHKDLMETGAWYRGYCRNTLIAKWQGDYFIYIRTKFGSNFLEEIHHADDDTQFDVFYPTDKIECP